MNRQLIRKLTHDASAKLTVDNSLYKQWVFRYTFLELEKDLGFLGDITTKQVFKKNFRVSAQVVAKQDGVVCGLDELKYFLVDGDKKFRPSIKESIDLDLHFSDGDLVKSGDVIFTLAGSVFDILAVERVLLNLLMRMSGVATFARSLSALVDGTDALLSTTRKTLWGLLDKRAAHVGGVLTHRLNLSDAILVKDSHLDLIDRDFKLLFEQLFDPMPSGGFIEIEVLSVEEAILVAELFSLKLDEGLQFLPVIMMDNMTAGAVQLAVGKLKSMGLFERILFEASGGICKENVRSYAETGVDIVSMGCITNSSVSLDMSLKILNGGRGGT